MAASLEVHVGRAFRSLATAVLLVAAAPAAGLSAETSVAETILEKAIASYRDGNLEPALGGINAALRGGLSSGPMARALYYRGLVYRKQGSPGHAISDLTRALDYDGLSEQERSDAMEARAAAYQEAGVANQEVVVISPTTGGGGKAPSQPPPQTTAAIVSPPATKPATTNWGGATQVAANAPLPVPTASQPELAARSGTTQLDPPAKRVEKPAPAPAPAKPWVTEAKKPAIAAEKSAPVAKAPTPPKKPAVAAAKAEKPSAPPNPAAIEVTPLAPLPASEMKVTVAAAKAVEAPPPVDPFVTQVVAVMPPPPPAPTVAWVAPASTPATTPMVPAPVTAAPAAPPEIRLLVGAAHSRTEAFALAVRLTSQRGPQLGPRRPQIADTTPPGTSPPLYRLRLGPFADAGQAQSLCRSLNDSGYACAVE
ncbi:hypothetical protein GIW81_05800 [Hyphomicrobium sp. xq]|uniref:SPOR domain-containing protein n=1 Tax=Hyphomicrobium album TaxID=2665159 RepID=A0A6I3KIG7_9HYPH|nr:SPOR domain-containing protein [Hyphomicrobium album]MTD93846.1 hypothetical protein [Hyphomicrobium album]